MGKAKWKGHNARGPDWQRSRVLVSVARLAGVLCVVLGGDDSDLGRQPLRAGADAHGDPDAEWPAGPGTCAENPGQDGCAMTALSLTARPASPIAAAVAS